MLGSFLWADAPPMMAGSAGFRIDSRCSTLPTRLLADRMWLLLGHMKIESTVRYLGVDVEDALTLAEHTEA
jgi:hypothetical protein